LIGELVLLYPTIQAITAGVTNMQRIGFIVARNFQFMSFAAMSVFEFANLVTGESAYGIRVMSEHGGPIRSSMGVLIDTELLQNSGFDTLIVGGGRLRLQGHP
jgi:transcriptional regulator GlxA family with amidase domain